jgi:2-succinyl-6-hydroxy-2,4-cyclohexadiene-1-carboxylate synthase
MPYQTIRQLRYHYEQTGSSTPVLLLHGFTGRGRNWLPLLHPSPFTLHPSPFIVDLIGHGATDAPDDSARYKMEFAAADLATLILDLTTPPIHLLGYSMGGRLALYLAWRYPHLFRSLVLESSSPGLATEAERQARRSSDEQLAQRIERDGIAPFVDYWEQIPLFASQAQLPETQRLALREQRLHNNPVGLANSLRGMGTGAQPSLWEHLPEIDLPILLLAGELDNKFAAIAGQMAQQLPQAELVIVPEAGHTIHLERPQTYTTHLAAFWNSRQ